MSPDGVKLNGLGMQRSETGAMTLASMTGFARTQGIAGDLQWAWELRSVNGRGLDLRLRLPSGFEALDQPTRKLAASAFARGNVSINLQVQWVRKQSAYKINEDWLVALQLQAEQIWKRGCDSTFDQIRPEGLLALRGVIEAVDEVQAPVLEASIQSDLLNGVENAIRALLSARAEEGAALKAIMADQFDQIGRLTADANAVALTQVGAIRDQLEKAIASAISDIGALSEDRLAQEIAILAAKADVREELDRLAAHTAAGRRLIEAGEPCGRKLEFLAQEFNREANTLCSKSQDIALTGIGLDLKAVIDRLREQVKNVE
jgi:uncharacterized protein (TIGR00255 family)